MLPDATIGEINWDDCDRCEYCKEDGTNEDCPFNKDPEGYIKIEYDFVYCTAYIEKKK